MNGYEEKIKDRLFLEVCNAAGREEWDGLAHQQKENLMLVCRLSGYDEKFQRDCGLVTREQMEHWGIEEEVLFQDAWANMFAKRPPLLMDFEDAYGHHYDQNILSMEKTPERIWAVSLSFLFVVNLLWPGFLRSSCFCISSSLKESPEGHPSITTPIAGP